MSSAAEVLRDAVAEACEQHEVEVELGGGTEQLVFSFPPQEGADAALLDKLFREEMDKTGITLDQAVATADMDDATVGRTQQALQTAIARLRVLLIEYNSYLSGGLDWVFPDSPTILRERGLAKYRYPARAPVDVIAAGDHMRITVHRSDLGKVTSSGFYVPTRVRGDFVATLRYVLEEWQPGDQSVCLALFAQDEPSRLRYYSQRRTAGTRPHEAMANFNNDVLTEPIPVAPPEGAFRVARTGQTVTSSHCEDGEWTVLGEHRGDPANDVIFGSKIWSSGPAGPFDARLLELRIDGEFPEDQIPPVPVRPDPRSSG